MGYTFPLTKNDENDNYRKQVIKIEKVLKVWKRKPKLVKNIVLKTLF